jgi:hypothetical protein
MQGQVLPQEAQVATETNWIHLVLFGMHMTFGPYLAAINRILISLMQAEDWQQPPKSLRSIVESVISGNHCIPSGLWQDAAPIFFCLFWFFWGFV